MAFWYIIFVAITAVLPLRSVLLGGIPFWYDPGRDFLLALDNLRKLTLIGPPGGIPGIFYGPYWLWLLSFPMIFTRNPRLIVLFAITIPYLIFFPLILWKMRRYFGTAVVFILWALFVLKFDNYLTFPWSPYLASLIFLILAYLVTQKKSAFLIGVTCALIPNFNFSFGVTILVATTIFQLVANFRKFPQFLLGVILAYSPLLLFELRHNFLQIRTFITVFINSAFYNTAAVGKIGMAKSEILPQLFSLVGGLPGALFLLGVILWKKLFTDRLVIFLTLCLGGLVFVYYMTKNPVWPYYFIGTETIFLLLLGRILSRSKILTVIFAAYVIYLITVTTISFLKSPIPNYLTLPTLVSKDSITRFVLADAKQESFTVYAYSPAIYTFDYDYLFRWLNPKPNISPNNIYLIIPSTNKSVFQDFINYKTPDKLYKTSWEKIMPDGTTVIKRYKFE